MPRNPVPNALRATQPATARALNDIKQYIDRINWLTDEDRHAIFESVKEDY